MKEVQVVTSHVSGSSTAWVVICNEIHGLMVHLGLPSFFITINLADIYNPLVKFLTGADIDPDNMLDKDVPKYWDQELLIAENPVLGAQFFNIIMKGFIKSILGFDPDQECMDGRLLGVIKGYYGCVESQGHSTLHCHMLIWVEGRLNPNEIWEKVMKVDEEAFHQWLLAFLDDKISSCIPPKSDVELEPPDVQLSQFHPCTVRVSLPSHTSHASPAAVKQHDLHNLVFACQQHKHQATCFKYSPDT